MNMPLSLVIAEHEAGKISSATLHAVFAAQKLGGDVDVLLISNNDAETVAQAVASIMGIRTVLYAQSGNLPDNMLAEAIASVIADIGKAYTHILAAATCFGKDVMPRTASMLGVSQISEIIAVESPDTFRRCIYAGNAIATVQSVDAIKVITVQKTAFPAASATGGMATLKSVDISPSISRTKIINRANRDSSRPDLTEARVVVSGGRALESKDNFKIIEDLADVLGGAVGASRAAVDAGFISNDAQVGQTGKIVAPELYIAVGISGAIQHIAGMKGSRVIVAINKDPDAPITKIADYTLIGDLFTIVPELINKLRK